MYNDKKIIEDFIKQHSILLFSTLTFYKKLPKVVERKAIDCYLKNLNRAIFRKSWKKLNLYLRGFAVREQNTIDGPGHYHLLIEDHDQIRTYKRNNISKLHDKSVWKVKNLGFEHDIQFTYSDGVIGYTLKDVYKFDDMIYFSKDGLA